MTTTPAADPITNKERAALNSLIRQLGKEVDAARSTIADRREASIRAAAIAASAANPTCARYQRRFRNAAKKIEAAKANLDAIRDEARKDGIVFDHRYDAAPTALAHTRRSATRIELARSSAYGHAADIVQGAHNKLRAATVAAATATDRSALKRAIDRALAAHSAVMKAAQR